MGLNYTTYVAALINLSAESTPIPSAAFTDILPDVIDYAEQRLYRELDLLSTVIRDSSANATANSRNFTLPQSIGRFVVVNGVNVVTPVGSTTTNGTRNALTPVSRDYLDFVWPSETAANADTVPAYFAMITDQTIIFGSPPGAAFNVEVVGTIRPTPISASNPTTFLSLYLPDLLVAASMIFISGWQQNFGQQADNPQMAQSWEQQYQGLIKSASTEEFRKKFESVSWTSLSPSPVAVPQRG